MKKVLFSGLATVLLLVSFAIPAWATKTNPNEDHKITICHALPPTASHPYNQITVDIASSGYVKGGHHVPGGELGDKHADGGDIIPPYEAFAKDGKDWVPFSYPGQNWTTEGQAIWENNCEVPEEPKEPTGFLTPPTCEFLFVVGTVENPTDEAITAHVYVDGTLADSFDIDAESTATSAAVPVGDGDFVQLFIGDKTIADSLDVSLDCGSPTVSPTVEPTGVDKNCDGHGQDRPKCNPTKAAPEPLAFTGVNLPLVIGLAILMVALLAAGLYLIRRKSVES